LLLLEAFRRLQAEIPSQLLFVGDGELRCELERRVAEARIPRVRFSGFLNQSEIGRAYSVADFLVLPSAGETWGLVLNEAMCFGLPVVASDRVGGAYDLVDDGITGFRFQYDDIDSLRIALVRVLRSEADRKRMGKAALERVSRYSIAASANGIVEGALMAARREPRPGAVGI
jgi:glycosyltransferase involved in cell wall biosynthesis